MFGSGRSSHLAWSPESVRTECAPFFKLGICKLKRIQRSSSVRRLLTFLPWMVSRLWKIQLVCTPYDHGFLVHSWKCETTITASQFHKGLEIILKEESQCYQSRRHLIHLTPCLMYNEMQKYLFFTNNLTDGGDAFKICHFRWWCCKIFWRTWSEFKMNLVRQKDE